MRTNLKVGLGAAGAVVVLAAASTLGLGAATGAFGSSGAARGAGPLASARAAAACSSPNLTGTVVTVTLSDRAGMMRSTTTAGPGGMMRGWPGQRAGSSGWAFPRGMMAITLSRAQVSAGTASFRVVNAGSLTHELVVLPLASNAQPGQRSIGSDGKVSETGSLGEASRTCAAGAGDGIAPHSLGWVTLDLKPGRYELICNLPGHYAAGMFAELDVAT